MNVDEKVDQLEAVTDPNTVISIGGYAFTPAKLMIAGGIPFNGTRWLVWGIRGV